MACNMNYLPPCRSKELTLPFPRQHPFTSHTPYFSVFPDTQPYCCPLPLHTQHSAAASHAEDTVQEGKVNAQTQTATLDEAVGVAHPPFQYYVAEKATKNGHRVERRYINSSPGIPLSREMLWDYPGSRRHQVTIHMEPTYILNLYSPPSLPSFPCLPPTPLDPSSLHPSSPSHPEISYVSCTKFSILASSHNPALPTTPLHHPVQPSQYPSYPLHPWSQFHLTEHTERPGHHPFHGLPLDNIQGPFHTENTHPTATKQKSRLLHRLQTQSTPMDG